MHLMHLPSPEVACIASGRGILLLVAESNSCWEVGPLTVELSCPIGSGLQPSSPISQTAEYSESFSESDQPAYQERHQLLVILITQANII